MNELHVRLNILRLIDTGVDNAGIRHVYDEDPKAEVQFTTECNIFATGQQYIEQPEIITEGRVDQYTEQCQVKRFMLDSSLDNKTIEFSNQSLESKNICLKKTVAQFQKDFSRMEAHCTSYNVKKENLRVCVAEKKKIISGNQCYKGFTTGQKTMTFEHSSSSLDPQYQFDSWKVYFGPLFDEYLNGENQVVSNSSAVTTADASDKRQQLPNSSSSTSTLATTVTANGNFDV
ncbi:hypothetical protein Tco_1393747 [Tanacetum coccineum]